jgi:HemY protein
VVSERWLPVTPNGRLDGFEWKLPLAELGVSRPVIEVVPPPPPPAEVKPVAETAPPPRLRKAQKSPEKVAKAKPVEPVIPLVHAPDDPGLDSGLDSGLDADPVPEPSTPPAADPWQRIRGLFR